MTYKWSADDTVSYSRQPYYVISKLIEVLVLDDINAENLRLGDIIKF